MHPGLWWKNTATGGRGCNPYMHKYHVYLNWCKKRYLKTALLAREAVLWVSIEPCASQSSQNSSKRLQLVSLTPFCLALVK